MNKEDFIEVMDEVRKLLDIASDNSRKARIEKAAIEVINGNFPRGTRNHEITKDMIAEIFIIAEKIIDYSDEKYGN